MTHVKASNDLTRGKGSFDTSQSRISLYHFHTFDKRQKRISFDQSQRRASS